MGSSNSHQTEEHNGIEQALFPDLSDSSQLSYELVCQDKESRRVRLAAESFRPKAAAGAFAAPDQLLRSLLAYSATPVFVLGRDGTYRLVNRAWEELTGVSQEDAVGRPLRELWPTEIANHFLETHRRIVTTALPQVVEQRADFPQGPRFFQVVHFPLFDEQGTVEAVAGIAYDITSQKQLETQLAQSEQRLKAIFEGVFQFIGLMSPDGTLLEANRSALTFGGVSAVDVVGQKLWQTTWCSYSPEAQECFRQATQQAAAGQFVRFDIRVRAAGGHLLWIDFSLSPVRDEGGRIIYLVPDGRLIEDRKHAEERFRTLFESAPVAYLIIDPEDNRIVDANERSAIKLGYPHEELVRLRIFDVDAQLTPEAAQPVKAAVLAGERIQIETLRRTKAGKCLDTLMSLRAIHLDGRDLICASLVDITERKQAERRQAFRLTLAERLRELTDPLAQMQVATALLGEHLGIARVGFGEVDASQEYITVGNDWNDGRMSSAVGTWRMDDFGPQFIANMKEGHTIAISDVAQDPRTSAPAVMAAFADIQIQALLNVPLLREGRMVALLFLNHLEARTWSPAEVALVEETVGRLWASLERTRAEQELQRSNEELERFASVASHDLQEPLRMIMAYSQLLARRYGGQLDADAGEFLGTILSGAQRMECLIRDLLAYARATSGERRGEKVDANNALAVARAVLRARLEETKAVLTCEILPEVRIRETLLVQVFQNLIGNALKYRRAHVTPEVQVSAERQGQQWIFRVKDNGLGIAAEDQDRIFELFTRLQEKGVSGTGIGLATVRRIVQNHGGRVWVESEPGVGSIFFFSLPAVSSDFSHMPIQ